MKLNDGEQIVSWILLALVVVALFPLAATYIVPFAIIGVFGLIALLSIGVLCYCVLNRIRNMEAPTVRVRAKVVGKRHASEDVTVDLLPGAGLNELAMMGREEDRKAAWKAYSHEARKPKKSEIMLLQWADCFITFNYNGRDEEFKVPADLYVNTPEGAEGLLVYQGEIFKHFISGVHEKSW